MSTLTIKRGIQFQADLYRQNDRTPWLEAVGRELEAKGIAITIGESASSRRVTNSAELIAAYKELQTAAKNSGATLQTYLSDLLQAIDDVVKPGAQLARGDSFDFSTESNLSKALGLSDGKRTNYASSSTTEFGRLAKNKPEATMAIDGVTLQIVEPAVPLDLSKIPHMSAQALRGTPVTYGRDGEEVEDTRVITGLTKEETVELARRSLNDLQRPRAAAGLSLGQVPFDEMSWDSDAHALRRANPYVSFTLDSRSLETNPNTGQPRVAVGRDFFFDTFMAKKDLATGALTKDLQKAELMYRARIRYGSDQDPFQGTRVLIGMKQGTAIAADGTKHARKIDSRTDSANQAIFDTLVTSTQTGKLDPSWSWNAGSVAPAAAAMYRAAVQKGITNDIGGETDVLALEPAAVARQIRGRFHLNETSASELQQAFRASGQPQLESLAAVIAAAPDFATNGELPSKSQLQAQVNALLDRSAIVNAAAEGLRQIDPGLTIDRALIDRLWPDQPIATKRDAQLQRVVADAIRSTYDTFAENVDALQRTLGGSEQRSVRAAGSASDVRDFLRMKSAVARFMEFAEASNTSNVRPGNAASYTAYARQVMAMPDGREKSNLLQNLGVGLNQLEAMNDAAFASPVRVRTALNKKQTFEPFISEFDNQLSGPQSQTFVSELSQFLSTQNNTVLTNATDKQQVLGDIRKNLVTAHVEIQHRMVEASAAWGQALWFSNYRRAAVGINPQSWNFIIGSMDYTEFYTAATGQGLTFQERVSRRPLDAGRMTGAMISNDMQIELEAEEGYTAAIRTAQYAVNTATAGLMMDYALSNNLPGLTTNDAAAFERWFAQAMTRPAADRETFLNDVATFARNQGSPIDLRAHVQELVEQEQAIRALVSFAGVKNTTLDVNNRSAVQAWYREQSRQPETELNAFLTELARHVAAEGIDIPLSPNLLRTLDFTAFTSANQNQPVASHPALLENLHIAQEVWAMMKKAQQDLSLARGQEVQRVLRDNDLTGKGWEPPTKPKGDYAIDYAIT